MEFISHARCDPFAHRVCIFPFTLNEEKRFLPKQNIYIYIRLHTSCNVHTRSLVPKGICCQDNKERERGRYRHLSLSPPEYYYDSTH